MGKSQPDRYHASARKLMVSMGEWSFESAVGGLGLAIGRLPLIDDDITAGRLVTAADKVVPAITDHWLITPPGVDTRREVVAFRNWLVKEMAQLQWNGHHKENTELQPAE